MDIEFNSIKELYERLLPALNTKIAELKRYDLDYIKKEDIWNYLKVSKWEKATDLKLYQMVDDILNLDNDKIDNYVKEEIRKKVIKPNLENMKVDDDNGKE
jgi:hypothetical protein